MIKYEVCLNQGVEAFGTGKAVKVAMAVFNRQAKL
jgi:hypothetical protein